MSARKQVMRMFPKAEDVVYSSPGFRPFTTIWSLGPAVGFRLGIGHTVAGAWRDALDRVAKHGGPVKQHLL